MEATRHPQVRRDGEHARGSHRVCEEIVWFLETVAVARAPRAGRAVASVLPHFGAGARRSAGAFGPSPAPSAVPPSPGPCADPVGRRGPRGVI